ncbi:Girdin [Geodia barretti]|uniref:Girdin n=1 Tax=Geodia barretti TaxID=519541 RepID=A0AA35XEJ0_GEOBA|nr:Girdin [Geodia barretti]
MSYRGPLLCVCAIMCMHLALPAILAAHLYSQSAHSYKLLLLFPNAPLFFSLVANSNLEGLCRTAYLHLQRVAKERDGHFEVLLDTMVERDYYKQVFESTDGGNESLPRENGLALPSTPVRSPSVNTELLDLKKKSRLTQEQLDHKSLQLSETREELERALAAVQKLQQERQEMAAEAKAARMYRDEIETLKVQSAKVEKLEADVKKYRQKAEDTEYLRKRIADLKQQNELMLETKSLLEQKAASLTARADMVDDLQTELASLRAQTESLAQEKEMSGEKEEELMARVTHLELDNKHCQEQIEELTTMLEAEREKSGVPTVVEHSALVCTLILVHSLL